MKIGVGVDIGGSHIVCGGVDLHSATLVDGTQFQRKLDRNASKEELFTAWAEPINQTIAAVKAISDSGPVAGIGFAMPGAYNYRKGIALFKGNDKYESLYGADIRKEFIPYLAEPLVPIRFVNDATAFGIGTAFLQGGEHDGKLIAITLGTGFGSSFIDAGVPVVGGHKVPPHGSLWHLPFEGNIADESFSTRWFVDAYEKATGTIVKGVKEVAEMAGTDRRAQALFDAFGTKLGRFLSPWVRRFEANKLVVGGNISKSWDLMDSSFQRGLGENRHGLKVSASLHLEEAALIGGAKLLDDMYWNRIKEYLPEK